MSDNRARGQFRGGRGDRGGRGRGSGRGHGDFERRGGYQGGGGSATFSGTSDRGGRGGGFRGDRGGFRGDRGGGRGRGGGGGGGRGVRDKFEGEPHVYGEGKFPAPDPKIAQVEDRIIANSLADEMAKLQLTVKKGGTTSEFFPCRPAFGNKGKPVTLWANYVRLDVKPQQLVKYSVTATKLAKDNEASKGKSDKTFEPKGRKLQRLIELALEKLGNAVPVVTEFKDQVISLKPLNLPEDNCLQVLYTDDGRDSTYKIEFTGPIDLNLDELRSYVNTMEDPTGNTVFPKFTDTVNAVGIILGHMSRASLNVGSLGSSRHFPLNMASESAPLGWPDFNSIIRGYFQSVRSATGRLLLNVNVSHGVFRYSGLVTDLMNNYNLDDNRSLQQLHRTLGRLQANVSFLADKGQKTESKGSGKKSKGPPKPPGVLRIGQKALCGLASQTDKTKANGIELKRSGARPHEVLFTVNAPAPPGLTAGKKYTVAEYFMQRYGRAVNLNYPVVNVGTRDKPIYMPAELVEIIPGQALRRKTDPEETRKMIEFACRSPAANAKSIVNTARTVLQLDNNPILAQFGVTADKTLLTITGRELMPPSILYMDQKKNQTKTTSTFEGSWNMREVRVVKSGTPINKWTWVHLDYQGSREPDNGLVKETVKNWVTFMGNNMGIKITGAPVHPGGVQIRVPRFDHYKAIESGFKQIPQDVRFVFVVLPDKGTANYNAIKTLADCVFGFHTICVFRNNFIKQNPQYYANVGLKVNLKAGGANHRLQNEMTIIKEGKTMVVGYDVTHPTNLSGNAEHLPSLVGLVASIDKDLGQWPAAAWSQKGKQEMLDKTLAAKFGERLKLWRQHNKDLPENIIIFRDGVSEGQFQLVLDKELPHIRRACEQLYPANRQPKISLIVSVKRHQTRFFPTDANNMTKSRNIKNGTVVDRGVTQTKMWDFFLTAHAALQGTARPAHYTVLLDEVFRSRSMSEAANDLEKLTHEMCYLFGRATKAVSICPPAYYADILCTRQRAYMSDLFEAENDTSSVSTTTRKTIVDRSIHPNLKDSMYYI